METDVDIAVLSALQLASTRASRLRALILRGEGPVDVDEVREALAGAGHPDVRVEWEPDAVGLRIAAAAFDPAGR